MNNPSIRCYSERVLFIVFIDHLAICARFKHANFDQTLATFLGLRQTLTRVFKRKTARFPTHENRTDRLMNNGFNGLQQWEFGSSHAQSNVI